MSEELFVRRASLVPAVCVLPHRVVRALRMDVHSVLRVIRSLRAALASSSARLAAGVVPHLLVFSRLRFRHWFWFDGKSESSVISSGRGVSGPVQPPQLNVQPGADQ